MRLRTALAGAVLAACSVGTTPPGTAPNTDPGASAAPSATRTTPVSIIDSAYGHLTARTAPAARCAIEVHVGPPRLGDAPPSTIDAIADRTGSVSVSYRAPTVPKQTGRHVVTCGTGTADAEFAVAGYPIPATRFTARIVVAGVNDQIDGVTARPDASLAPARDRDVELLTRTVVAEWSAATRGLSTLELVAGAPADIVLTVVTARADSFLRHSSDDGSAAIYLFPAAGGGLLTADNFVAVALHELGHIWCCSGPDASADGHWAVAVADPLLQGVDRFGLMNHPVQCTVFASGVESCPNRFSERELRTMGFTRIPPPAPNPCVDSKTSLEAQLAAMNDRLATAKAGIERSAATLAGLNGQIRAIETKYPNGIPRDVYPSYLALIDQYNAEVATRTTQVTAYNALLAQTNAVIAQLNALLC
ncbi:MAG: hypothetical protein M3Z65_09565 [Chloroflexota bacterium]|nr:hypothetical protein [Chloroflexota bacterium]